MALIVLYGCMAAFMCELHDDKLTQNGHVLGICTAELHVDLTSCVSLMLSIHYEIVYRTLQKVLVDVCSNREYLAIGIS